MSVTSFAAKLREAGCKSQTQDPVLKPLLPFALLFAFYLVCAITLDHQSLWLDEVYSLWFVNRPFDDAWRTGIFPEQNPHAPLYYTLLWGWIRLAGASDFALRYFSLACGALSAAVLWWMSYEMFGARLARIALLLFVVSPFALWHAQEARQYALYLLLSLVSSLLFARSLKRGTRKDWASFSIFAALTAYAHFFGMFTIAAQALAAFILSLRNRANWIRVMLSFAFIAAMCSPIPLSVLGSARTFDTRDVTRAFLPLGVIGREMLAEFVTRLRFADVSQPALLYLFAALSVVGLIASFRRNARNGFLIACLLVSPVIAYFGASFRVSAFNPKYLISVFPIFLVCVALGISEFEIRSSRMSSALHHLAKIAMLFVVFGALAQMQSRDLTQPAFQRENWRLIAMYLDDHAEPNDVIMVFADYASRVIEHYYRGSARIVPFGGDPKQPEPIFDQIQNAQPPARKLWLLLSHDEVSVVGHRLIETASARYVWTDAQYPTKGAVKLLGYSMRWRHERLPTNATHTSARFANGLELVGYQIDKTRLTATENDSHPPSNWIHVVSYWRRWKSVEGESRVILRMTGAEGDWGGELAREPSVFAFDPPQKWENDVIVERHDDVNLNPATPPNRYALIVALERSDQQRVPLENKAETNHILATIEIVP
jgi:hypothetical protein